MKDEKEALEGSFALQSNIGSFKKATTHFRPRRIDNLFLNFIQ